VGMAQSRAVGNSLTGDQFISADADQQPGAFEGRDQRVVSATDPLSPE